jgi:NifU-like protein involved in Fe-S cluster formation
MLDANALLLDHFDRPSRGGAFPTGTRGVRQGTAGSERHGAVVQLALKTDGAGRIEDSRFKAWGCAGTLACASFIADWAVGRTLDEARQVEVRALAEPLGLPP